MTPTFFRLRGVLLEASAAGKVKQLKGPGSIVQAGELLAR